MFLSFFDIFLYAYTFTDPLQVYGDLLQFRFAL